MNNDRTDIINFEIGSNNEVSMQVGSSRDEVSFDVVGGSGTSNYERLSNKPQINSVELIGNKTSDELNIQRKGNYANTRITNIEIDNLFR